MTISPFVRMSSRVFNFYSGPATLPLSVLQKAQAELTDFRGSGMSVMELSHRSDSFLSVLRSAETRLRKLLKLPDNFRVLFLQGGASLQFSMVPMNFLAAGSADYIVTGTWSEKALKAASEFGVANAIRPAAGNGYVSVPLPGELRFNSGAKYIHYVSNETIDGVEFQGDLDGFGTPVVCDASSNILSRPINIEKYSLIYAGAQKNIGPSGITVVICSDEFLESCRGKQKGVLSYTSFAENESMPNTPNTWGIYVIDLVCEWLEAQGGLERISDLNERKSKLIYDAIDGSDGYYQGTVERSSRSRMNVTFRLTSAELETAFCDGAQSAGLVGLKGHRSVGGIRASIYNAFPVEGVERLVEYMGDFAQNHG